MKGKEVDVGIVTIISVEIEALFKTLNIGVDNVVETGSPFNYWITEFYSLQSQRSITVVVSFISRDAGNIESAICTSYFLQDWYPRLMCLVGIAAGIKGKTRIGDVVIPNRIHDRTNKVFKNNDFVARGVSSARTDNLERMIKVRPVSMEEFRLEYEPLLRGDIQKSLAVAQNKKLTLDEFDGNLQLHDGSLSSDNVLIRDDSYFSGIITETDEKCRGGDMESAGFVRACQIEDSAFPWLVFRGISDFGDNRKDDSFHLLAAKSASIALRMYLEKCINLDQLRPNPRAREVKASVEVNLLDQVKEAYQAKRWPEVCQTGNVISRYLWLSGQHDLRVEIGRFVEEASSYIEDNSTRARTLIDDLGWTLFTLGKTLEAKKHIKDGARIAKDIGNFYLLAKAKRHMASIARQANEVDEALTLLDEAKHYAAQITDSEEKAEMLDSLLASEGKLLLAKKMIPEAISKFTEAIDSFKRSGDTNRESKIYAVLGDAYLKSSQESEAIRLFYDGRKLAFNIGRFDEVAKNTRLLIDNLGENHQQEKIRLAREVLEFAETKGLLTEAKRWKATIDALKKQPNDKLR